MRRQPENDDALLEGTDGGQPTVLQEEVNPLRRHRNACRQEGWEQLHKGRIHTLIILRIKKLIIFNLKLLMDLIIHVSNALQRQTFASPVLQFPLSIVWKILSHNGDLRNNPPNTFHHCGKKLVTMPCFS